MGIGGKISLKLTYFGFFFFFKKKTRSHNCKEATLSLVMSVCPSAWRQLGSHWTDCNEIWYL